MIKIAICDDMDFDIKNMVKILRRYPFEEKSEIYTYATGKDTLNGMKEHDFDIVIMDIVLAAGENGIDISNLLKSYNRNIILLYYSGYTCYFENMLETEPYGYIGKPIIESDVHRMLDRAYKWYKQFHGRTFCFSFNGVEYAVKLYDILYFCSAHRKVEVHTLHETYEYYDKLDNVQSTIDGIVDFFVRVSKSYYINLYNVAAISKKSAVIDEEKIPVSQKYYKQNLEKIKKYLLGIQKND